MLTLIAFQLAVSIVLDLIVYDKSEYKTEEMTLKMEFQNVQQHRSSAAYYSVKAMYSFRYCQYLAAALWLGHLMSPLTLTLQEPGMDDTHYFSFTKSS